MADVVEENPILLDLSLTWGSMMIGLCISFTLFGIATMQTYLYFWNYPEDSWSTKALVLFLWALEASHEALGVAVLWHIFVLDYGGILKLGFIPTTMFTLTWLQTISGCTVQLYFIRRVWLFDKRKRWWPIHALMIAASIWSPIAYTYVLDHGRGQPITYLGSKTIVGLGTSSIAAEAFVDAFIAIFLTALLSRRAQKSRSTKGLIQRLQVLVINTGMFTAINALIALIIFIVKPSTFLDFPFYFTFSTLYLVCILTNLNARRYVRGQGGTLFITDLITQITEAVPSTVASNTLASHSRDGPIRLLELNSNKGRDGVMINVDIEQIGDRQPRQDSTLYTSQAAISPKKDVSFDAHDSV